MKKIKSRLILLFFGSDSLKGYYKPSEDKRKKMGYRYCSVFPDKETVNLLLKNEMEDHECYESIKHIGLK